jgi:hypothetical protein
VPDVAGLAAGGALCEPPGAAPSFFGDPPSLVAPDSVLVERSLLAASEGLVDVAVVDLDVVRLSVL